MKVSKSYYLIICSRGVGSETIIVESVATFRKNNREYALNFNKSETRKAEKRLEKSPVIEVECDFNDEGSVICLRKGAQLKDIWGWLKEWDKGNQESNEELEGMMRKDKESKDLFDSIKKAKKENHGAFLSACLRAFVIHMNPVGPASRRGPGGGWTSCNSWRDGNNGKVSEGLTKRQYEMVLSCGITVEELENWDCRVMRHAYSKYSEEGRIIKKGW